MTRLFYINSEQAVVQGYSQKVTAYFTTTKVERTTSDCINFYCSPSEVFSIFFFFLYLRFATYNTPRNIGLENREDEGERGKEDGATVIVASERARRIRGTRILDTLHAAARVDRRPPTRCKV